jgi:hypothetical protein
MEIKTKQQYKGIVSGIIFTVTRVSNKSVSITFTHEDRLKKANITKEHLRKYMIPLTPSSIRFMENEI